MTVNHFAPVRHNHLKALQGAMQRPGFQEAWDANADQYSVLRALLKARMDAGLTIEEIAARMGTSKRSVSRLENSLRGSKRSPSFAMIRRYANACGKRVEIQLV